MQHNLKLWAGAYQAQTTTNCFTWFKPNNRYDWV